MKLSLVALFVSVMTLAPSLVRAFDCSSARVTANQYAQRIEEVKKELSDMAEKKNRLAHDYYRFDSDLENDLAQVQKEYKIKMDELSQSIHERQAIGEWHKRTSDELSMGLYCSKCNRSKSEIERAEHKSFNQHLENVKGSSKSAPAAVLHKAFEDYKEKRAISYQKSVIIEKDMDRLEAKMDELSQSAASRKNDLLALQSRIEYERKELGYRETPKALELMRLESEMRTNNCGQ